VSTVVITTCVDIINIPDDTVSALAQFLGHVVPLVNDELLVEDLEDFAALKVRHAELDSNEVPAEVCRWWYGKGSLGASGSSGCGNIDECPQAAKYMRMYSEKDCRLGGVGCSLWWGAPLISAFGISRNSGTLQLILLSFSILPFQEDSEGLQVARTELSRTAARLCSV
jgi:hypothetical protein